MGHGNVAAIGQVGEGHERTINQIGDNMGQGSLQASNDHYATSYSGTGGNAFTSTTLDITISD